MLDGTLSDENVGWPSYVDFLATFLFVLLMFVTWSINLIAGVERDREIHEGLLAMQKQFAGAGFEAVIEGKTLRIPLRNKVVFSLNSSDLNARSEANLQQAGRLIAENMGVKRIIVMGYSDRVQPRHDLFRNWTLSVDRAEAVLRFLYSCTNCGYNPEDIRPKLVLHGTGDLDSRLLNPGEQFVGDAGDRRVDIVLDWADNEIP